MKTKFFSNIIIPVSISTALVLSSCNSLLDREEDSFIDKTATFDSYNRTKQYLTYAYSLLPEGLNRLSDGAMLDAATDDAEFAIETANVQQFNNGSWSALSNPDDHWNRYYAGISKCCTLLENTNHVNLDITRLDPNKQVEYANNLKDIRMWRAEARFLRAYFQFELLKRYGPTPIVTSTLSLNENYEISDMVEEIAYCIKKLNIDKVDVVGVSQGGMIAQLLAINYPDIVDKLVLVATTSRNNPTTNKVIDRWIVLAENGKLQDLQKNMIETVYSKGYIAKNKWLSILVQILFKPKLDQLDRFIVLARSCLKFDVFDELDKIQAKTLVIGAALDQVIPVGFSNELAKKINCQKLIFEESGHAVHQEVSDFNRTILNFLKSSN